jgi:hypothetical protein
MDRELYFLIAMAVDESHEQIVALNIQTSLWSRLELSPFPQRYPLPSVHAADSRQSTYNAQMALTALSTYAKLSSHRALTFARLATNLNTCLSPACAATMHLVSRKGKQCASDSSLPLHCAKKVWLGERAIIFRRGAVGVVVTWDNLGFAGSKVSVALSVPRDCTTPSLPGQWGRAGCG